MIHNIVYISAAVRPFTRDELAKLLKECRTNNEKEGITGLLMYHDQQFFQVLEGPANKLESIYKKISCDQRHRGVLTLQEGQSEQRHFSQWEMGLAEISNFSDAFQGQFVNLCKLHEHKSFEELNSDPIVSIFARTFLEDIREFCSLLETSLK
ncbi:BLUF domain-containing protein [Kordiimonas aquimaris]|uniref:BLUF domain-containing protein n=1 Tax=Kordiimonas aquimaris TaxID=707591 RepID=UPI0021CDFB2B|nr:BLUF domain-containing protein [Kordiimonas aquimaris]